ncbi:hypothetical protein [Streptomyces sp. NPDC057686]
MLIRIRSAARAALPFAALPFAALPFAAHPQESPYDRNHRTAHRA